MTLRRVLSIAALAIAAAAAGCERPALDEAPSRAPDVRFEPTPHHVVAEMMRLAKVGASDVVYDLGCGDGRIVIAAATLGARGVCVDIDPRRIGESRANAAAAGVAERIVLRTEDLFQTEIAGATVVTLFLWPDVNLKLRPRLWRELRPGTRVISYVHSMGDWAPQEVRNAEGAHGPRKLFLWVIPPTPQGVRTRSIATTQATAAAAARCLRVWPLTICPSAKTAWSASSSALAAAYAASAAKK